jgi:hypothetical protein
MLGGYKPVLFLGQFLQLHSSTIFTTDVPMFGGYKLVLFLGQFLQLQNRGKPNNEF